jgi:hypothetical protein
MQLPTADLLAVARRIRRHVLKNASMVQLRRIRRSGGICTVCGAYAAYGRTLCKTHGRLHVAGVRRYRERKTA